MKEGEEWKTAFRMQ
jgi:hypothetical protein